jgi:hypothetical protein
MPLQLLPLGLWSSGEKSLPVPVWCACVHACSLACPPISQAMVLRLQEARQHAQQVQSRPLPSTRKAWVEDLLDAPATAGGGGRLKRPGTARAQLAATNSGSEPDMDAVSLRIQPNATRRGVLAEASPHGSRVRIVSAQRPYSAWVPHDAVRLAVQPPPLAHTA